MGILEKLRRGERVDHFETVRLRKNGTRFDVSLTISPVKDPKGRLVGASKVARDISERKRAEQTHKEAELSARLLQVQDEERRRIARELHDGVGQLLSAVGMNVSQILTEKGKLSPAAVRSAEDMRFSIERVRLKFAQCPTYCIRLCWMKSGYQPHSGGTSMDLLSVAR
jgi:signal transduction histidine kinase